MWRGQPPREDAQAPGPAENLTDDIRVEDEARHSGVDGTQAHARATQHGVEVLPPLLAAIIGLGREPREPPPERLVLPAGTTPSKALSPWSACHWCSSLTAYLQSPISNALKFEVDLI